MALDIYGEKPVTAGRQVVGQAMKTGQAQLGSLFGEGQAAGAMQPQMQLDEAKLNEAVDAWGRDLVKNWNQNSGQIMQALDQDLTMMREEASRARQENDMQRYQLAMEKILFDKQMKAYGDLLDKANRHNLLNAILYGGGQVAAGLGARKFETEERLRTEQEKEDIRDEISSLFDFYDYTGTPGSMMGK